MEYATKVLKLYALLQQQKKFKDIIIVRIDMEDTCKLNFTYHIPIPIQLSIDIDIDELTNAIESKLFCEPLDVFTCHLIALELLSEKFNPINIGVCVDEYVENIVKKKAQELSTFQNMNPQ